VKRGETITVTVERFGAEGKSVARVEGFVVFVRSGVPGDTAAVRLTRVSKNFADADIVSVVTPSPLRTTPQCAYFGVCGGCTWQHLSYEGQCAFKRQQVVDALERIGGFPDIPVHPTIGSGQVYHYRNKMEFSFGVRWLTKEELEHVTAEGGTGTALRWDSTSRSGLTGSWTLQSAICSRPRAQPSLMPSVRSAGSTSSRSIPR